MFTKETAITLPLMILLYEYWFLVNGDMAPNHFGNVWLLSCSPY